MIKRKKQPRPLVWKINILLSDGSTYLGKEIADMLEINRDTINSSLNKLFVNDVIDRQFITGGTGRGCRVSAWRERPRVQPWPARSTGPKLTDSFYG